MGGAVKVSWSEDREPSAQPRADDGRARPLRADPDEREQTGFCLAFVCCFSKTSFWQSAVSELPNSSWVAISYQFVQRLRRRGCTKRSGATSPVHNGGFGEGLAVGRRAVQVRCSWSWKQTSASLVVVCYPLQKLDMRCRLNKDGAMQGGCVSG